MRIREVKKEEFNEFFDLYFIYFRYLLDLEDIPKKDLVSLDKIRNLEKNDLKKDFNDFKHKIFVAIIGDKIVGFIKFHLKCHPHLKNKVAEIEDIFVLPKYRKKGIAKKFFKKTKIFLKSKKIKSILLNFCSKNIAAVKLYKKIGFVEIYKRMKLSLS